MASTDWGLLGAMILQANANNPRGRGLGGVLGNAFGNYNQMQAIRGKQQLQNQLAELQLQQMQGQMSESAAQRERLQGVRDANPNNHLAQIDPGEFLKSQLPQKQKLPSGMMYGPDGSIQAVPGYIDMQSKIKSAGAPRTNLTVSTQDTPEQIEAKQHLQDRNFLSERARKRLGGYLDQSTAAAGTLSNINMALNLLDKVQTGTFEEAKLAARKIGGALGFNVDFESIGSAEQLRTLLGDEVMARIAQTKGGVSEKEMDLFTSYSANFGNTPEGNRNIFRFKKAKYERDIKIGRMIRRMMKDKKSSVEIDEAVDKYLLENDLSGILQNPGPDGSGDEFDKFWGSA